MYDVFCETYDVFAVLYSYYKRDIKLGMTPTRKARDPIDIHVGQRLRARRNALGMSQEKLGEAIGVSFQMVQKYERGDCRVGASRLMKTAQALGVSVAHFFEGFNGGCASPMAIAAEDGKTLDDNVMKSRETIQLLKAYYTLPDSARREVMNVIKAMEEIEAMGDPRQAAKG